jgi:hypothetical protein
VVIPGEEPLNGKTFQASCSLTLAQAIPGAALIARWSWGEEGKQLDIAVADSY